MVAPFTSSGGKALPASVSGKFIFGRDSHVLSTGVREQRIRPLHYCIIRTDETATVLIH